MERVSTESQTIYSQIVESSWSDPIVYGSFSKKKVKGKSFLYQGYSIEGKQRQVYIGEANDELMAKVDIWKSHNRDLQRLTAMAIKGGCLETDRLTEAVIMRFAEAGWFRAGGLLIGSHAFALLGNVIGARWSGEAMRTRDVDIATPRHIAIAAKPDIGNIIEELGYTPIPSLNRKHPPTSYTFRGKQTKIDLLTPESGRPATSPRSFPNLGVAAQPLRFLDYLMEDSVQAASLASTAVAIRVPDPARFAFHKLILAERRHATEQAKASKDIIQAESLFSILLEDRPGDIDLAYEAIVKNRWKKHVQFGLSKLNDAVREELKKRMS